MGNCDNYSFDPFYSYQIRFYSSSGTEVFPGTAPVPEAPKPITEPVEFDAADVIRARGWGIIL
jgi:hypothetical protein